MLNETRLLCLTNILRYDIGFERDFTCKKEFMLGINILYIFHIKGYLHENVSLK